MRRRLERASSFTATSGPENSRSASSRWTSVAPPRRSGRTRPVSRAAQGIEPSTCALQRRRPTRCWLRADAIKQELEKHQETLTIRVKAIQNQEKALGERYEDLGRKIQAALGGRPQTGSATTRRSSRRRTLAFGGDYRRRFSGASEDMLAGYAERGLEGP